MNTVNERLITLRVSDIMKTHLITVSVRQTMAEAACVLARSEISGAPVVDEVGKCVGVLTATDFVRRERARNDSERQERQAKQELFASDRPYQLSPARGDLVADWMSPVVQSIDASATLSSAAHEMCLGHLHHLFVLNNSGHVAGVITSLDIVAALANIGEEAKSKPFLGTIDF
jgi:CBS domain-containing membrane protein